MEKQKLKDVEREKVRLEKMAREDERCLEEAS